MASIKLTVQDHKLLWSNTTPVLGLAWERRSLDPLHAGIHTLNNTIPIRSGLVVDDPGSESDKKWT